MQVNLRIRSIRKGVSQEYWKVGDKIAHITPERKHIRFDRNNPVELLVYRGYDHQENLLFEVEADSSLTITYFVKN
jgi:hypothetical protein